jgi:hypothetical protein
MQLNASQAEVAELRRANDDLAWHMAEQILLHQDAKDNARVAARMSAEHNRRFDALNGATLAAIHTVMPMGASVEQRLRAFSAWIMELANHDIR